MTFAPKDEAEKVGRYGVEYVDASYRPNYGDLNFHTDDIQPCYLPDGGIPSVTSLYEIALFYEGHGSLLHKSAIKPPRKRETWIVQVEYAKIISIEGVD